VNVSVGIPRAAEGVAAEKWLAWRTGRVGWYESGMAFDPVFRYGIAGQRTPGMGEEDS